MKRLSIAITLADNGGMTMFGPLALSQGSKTLAEQAKQRMYISHNLDPLTVGTNLLAMLADLAMTEKEPSNVVPKSSQSDDVPF